MQERSLLVYAEPSSGFCGRLYVRPRLRPKPLPGLPLRGMVLRFARRAGSRPAIYACPVEEAVELVVAGEA